VIDNFKEKYVDGIIKLWNNSTVEDGYKELTIESFSHFFLKNSYFEMENTFVRIDDGEVTGFACGCTGDDLPYADVSGYITCIILSPKNRTIERFSELLGFLERTFEAQGKQNAEVIYINPIKLPWYIPGTPRHEHNNAPGALTESFYHISLLKNGFYERAREFAMYRTLDDFSIPEEVLSKERRARELGYEVAMFDRAMHSGVDEMLDKLDNPLWKREIPDCTGKGIPVVIVAHSGSAVGFAGPVIRQSSGRGYFAGIGIHPEHQSKGLGSILFFRLCQEFKNIGTSYMSLFTGKENPGRKIYEKAGFIVVREFAVMRKELKQYRKIG